MAFFRAIQFDRNWSERKKTKWWNSPLRIHMLDSIFGLGQIYVAKKRTAHTELPIENWKKNTSAHKPCCLRYTPRTHRIDEFHILFQISFPMFTGRVRKSAYKQRKPQSISTTMNHIEPTDYNDLYFWLCKKHSKFSSSLSIVIHRIEQIRWLDLNVSECNAGNIARSPLWKHHHIHFIAHDSSYILLALLLLIRIDTRPISFASFYYFRLFGNFRYNYT